jgi:o-succinylbenzoate---CoA ligase
MILSCFDAAEKAGQRLALVWDGGALTYGELAKRVRDLGLPGQEPLVATPDVNGIVRLHAHLAAGTAALLVHPRWTEAETRRAIAELLPEDGPTHREPLADDCRPLAILFTSGSTGRPKAVELSRAAFLAAAQASEENLGWQEEDRWLLSLPFSQVGGLSVLTRCLAARRTAVLSASDPKAICHAVASAGVTLMSLVPAQLAQLLGRFPSWNPPRHVRAILIGGAVCPAALLAEAAGRGWPVLTSYGLTEACSQVATQRLRTINRGEQGCGPPLRGIQVRIADGLIEVRGPTLFTRYRTGSGGAPRRGEWFATEDLGEIDALGHLHVLGRRDETIVTGGAKVMPAEVEEALRACPQVADACVFGVPDVTWGQRISAAVVLRAPPLNAGQLKEALSGLLAPYKQPRHWVEVPALPLLPSGKVDRRRVSEAYRSQLTPVA